MADDKTAAQIEAEARYPLPSVEHPVARRAGFVAGAAWQAEQAAVRRVTPDRETVAEWLWRNVNHDDSLYHLAWTEFPFRAWWLAKADDLLALGVLGVPADPGLHFECNCVPELGPTHCHGCSEVAGTPIAWTDRKCPADQRTADPETIARTLAMTDDENGCFERVDAWEALPDWEKEARPDEEPFSDREDCAYWLRRADAVLAVLVPADQVRAEGAVAALDKFRAMLDTDQGANYEAAYTIAGVSNDLEEFTAEYRKAAGA